MNCNEMAETVSITDMNLCIKINFVSLTISSTKG